MDRPYTYDAAGQRNTETTPDHARTFTYDAQRQLVDATGTVGTTGTEQFDFTFDGIGNRQSSSLSTLNSQLSTSYATNSVNQYTALTGALADTPAYDANGNTTGLSGKLLAYDEENRLKQVSDTARTVTYIYDGLGRRVERIDSVVGGATTGTRYIYDGWRAVEELASSSSTWALSCSYTRGIDLSRTPEGAGGIGGLLARATPNGGTWTAATYAYDGNGNVTDLFNDNGINAAHYTYGPFGERLTATGALADVNTVQFSSKERDAFTAFYYYGLRYYNPSTGRWINRDPIGERGGRNLYCSCVNNLINLFDALGLTDCKAMKDYITQRKAYLKGAIDRAFGDQGGGSNSPFNTDDALDKASTAVQAAELGIPHMEGAHLGNAVDAATAAHQLYQIGTANSQAAANSALGNYTLTVVKAGLYATLSTLNKPAAVVVGFIDLSVNATVQNYIRHGEEEEAELNKQAVDQKIELYNSAITALNTKIDEYNKSCCTSSQSK